MNMKGMILAIVIVMAVMTMFASSAMAITVDGHISPANEWDIYDEKIVDTDGQHICSSGYNITTLWMRVEGDTLFVRMDVAGVAGDADTDGDDTTNTNTNSATCGCDPNDGDMEEYPGVGIGANVADKSVEEYIAKIDGDNDGDYDYYLKYQLGSATLYDSGDVNITGATRAAAHDGAGAGMVELSVKIDQYCDINPANYCVKGEADTDCSGTEEDVPKICHYDAPPTAECSFTPISCGQGTLSGTGSSDDGTIEKYSWDFGNDGSYDAYGAIVTSYNIIGTHAVRLMVTDDLGQTANCTLSATLTGDPTAVAKVNGVITGSVQLPVGGMDVTFDGTGSSAYSPATLDLSKCQWTIPGETCPTGLGPHTFFMDLDHAITATLKVEDNHGCTDYASVRILPPPTENVPLLTLPGLLALIGMMCIAGAGRILTKGRRS